ncbi:MAG: TonB family protein [Burkholderiaceae bacterium]
MTATTPLTTVMPGPSRLPGWLRDRLMMAIAVSLLLHAALLSLHFAPPAPLRLAPTDPRLEVILLNARTEARPAEPEVLAQVDMVGGGDRDSGRATSPLPAMTEASDGDALAEQSRRVAELEARQRELMSLAAGQPMPLPTDRPAVEAPVRPDGSDEEDVDAVIARLQARIDQQISDYNKRPKRLAFGINAVGVSYARYVEDWAERIERIGTERYPVEARGRLYDSLIITVEIDRDGSVVDVIIDKPSKHEALNRAVREIVLAGAPYPPFSAEMAREGDILQIVRTWNFTRGGLETESREGS